MRRHFGVQPELLLDRPLSSRSHLPLSVQALRLLRRIDRYPGLYLPRVGGAALAALIAYQCATLYGVIVTPLDGPPEQAARPPQDQPATSIAAFDPFFQTAGPPAHIAATDLALHGLRQDRRTGGGSAIISQSGGAQRSFGIGEEIGPGIALKQVGSDHVIIVRHGLDERLSFKEFASRAPADTPPARSAPSPYTPTLAASPAVEVQPKRPTPLPRTLPARSIDFADPSTLPASLTAPKR